MGRLSRLSQKAGTPSSVPALAGAIFRQWEPAKLEAGTSPSFDVQSLCRQLPFIKEFIAASGDWVAVKRQFLTNADVAGWSEADALKALPADLDDDTLAAFLASPLSERSTLTQAFYQMAAVFEPPLNTHQKFAMRRRGDGESALAYRSALLALAKAAFPKMDHNGLDPLVLEKMLGLAKDLHTVLRAEDGEVSSLKIARCRQVHPAT
ncbi:unnamed protein product [Lampetra fluviatilis]